MIERCNMETKLLKGKYRIERQIASGGMSTVYLCTNMELHNRWIVKHIEKKYSELLYEEEILRRLYHINLPRIVDIHKDETGVYLIESYIEGVSLQKKLQRNKDITLEQVIEYSIQLCDVVYYLHSLQPHAIIHKDIKPSNILITQDDKAVLIDFGISEERGSSRFILRAATNKYAAPEQLTHNQSVDSRSDIYSLGIVIHEMLEAVLELSVKHGQSIQPASLVKSLEKLCTRCTRFLPGDRFQNVKHIKEELIKLRSQYIIYNEGLSAKRKWVIWLIFALSLLNYLCLLWGIILIK